MRKLILSSVAVLTLAGCSASAIAAPHVSPAKDVKPAAVSKASSVPLMKHVKPETQLTFIQERDLHYKRLAYNTKRVEKVLKQLKTYAGKTWYVFSGSSPRGWDCSGLVRWTYLQLGIELEHRASVQADLGERVSRPVPGDIVAYFYPGGTRSYHTAIYIGDGKMINAPRPGTRTAIEPVHTYRLKGSQVRYIRIIEQLREKTN